MMWRKVGLIMVVGLLVSGLFGGALAERPPTRGTGWGPEPRPWQWGDPDGPAFSKHFNVGRRLAVGYVGELIPPASLAAEQDQSRFICHVRGKQSTQSRRYEVRVLGLTIAIRR